LNKTEEIKFYERENKKAECTTRQLTEEEKIKYGLKRKDNIKIMNLELQINENFKNLLPPLHQEEFDKLEELILKDGCKDSIKVWKDNISNNLYIIDGHNRHSICLKHNVEFKIEEIIFDTQEDVLDWIIKHQFGRRNINDTQKAYLRGLQYENEKNKHGGNRGNQYTVLPSGTNCHLANEVEDESFQSIKTADRIGQEHQVSERAIREDGKFANALDKIADTIGIEAKNKILNKEKIISKQDVINIGNQINNGTANVDDLKKEIIESEDKKVKFPKIENTETKKGRPPKKELKMKTENKKKEDDDVDNNIEKESEIEIETHKESLDDIADENLENTEKDNNELNDLNNQEIEQEEIPIDNIKESIKDIKTPKYIEDTFNFVREVENFKENIIYTIETFNDDLFEIYNVEIIKEEKIIALRYVQELIDEMIKLKNKINNIKENN